MKKLLFLTFVVILSFIFYQLVLGNNGLIEGYKLRKEYSALNNYIEYLKSEKISLEKYAEYLKENNSQNDAKEELANHLGFFRDPQKILFRIRKDLNNLSLNIGESNTYLKEYVKVTSEVEKINTIKKIISGIFYIIISIFILLIVFGVDNDES